VTGAHLPAVKVPYGPFADLALRVHDLTVKGRHPEALRVADETEWVATLFGDEGTARMIQVGRMYALLALGRFEEALVVGEGLVQLRDALGPRSSQAKLLADTAEVLIRLGRTDDGLRHLARAIALLEVAPRGTVRYVSAMSSMADAARAAELFEFADECARVASDAFSTDDLYRSAAELQRAELLLEWGLRLEQIGRGDEANARFARSVALSRHWAEFYADAPAEEAPLAHALLALGLAKVGESEEALAIVDKLLMPLREEGLTHEARLVHLAYALALRARGELRAARREFIAADELTDQPGQRLILWYELAALAAVEAECESTRIIMSTVRTQMDELWRLRVDRRTMLRQARRRVDLEAARIDADLVASSDALTGLGNRRLFDRHIDELDGAVVLLLVDVDKFKGINDRFSHGVGDKVLREVAAVLRAHCRADEVAVRFGGDEFALFLRTDLSSAATVAERIRQVIAARDWETLAVGLRVTLSIGLAAFTTGMTGRELYDRADRHLYVAKRTGRDRIAA
jgi:diguanylate cyclase